MDEHVPEAFRGHVSSRSEQSPPTHKQERFDQGQRTASCGHVLHHRRRCWCRREGSQERRSIEMQPCLSRTQGACPCSGHIFIFRAFAVLGDCGVESDVMTSQMHPGRHSSTNSVTASAPRPHFFSRSARPCMLSVFGWAPPRARRRLARHSSNNGSVAAGSPLSLYCVCTPSPRTPHSGCGSHHRSRSHPNGWATTWGQLDAPT